MTISEFNRIDRIFTGVRGHSCVRVKLYNIEMKEWCVNTFGDDNARWTKIGNLIIFTNEEDRNWFILRWSS